MKSKTILRLNEQFNESPILFGGPVTSSEIDQAEKHIGVKFPLDYREFIELYGGAIVGSLPIIGLRQAEVMGDDTVVSVTDTFRVDKWYPTTEWAVISVDLGGNPIGLNSKGEVWLSDHDFGEIIMIAPTFEDFLIQLLDGSSTGG
ncbi:SMI1/KNR4 family protein [Myxococcota bacterium]|nr:SMI1/KNR4 family protein [Myxococcota bacterium]MBU1381296.1 SMI1/KNR4 family protein [Myxococcota bacterium]MBU1495365.1 SMI1/KNR4 family protein [Myxococcota bacterium]